MAGSLPWASRGGAGAGMVMTGDGWCLTFGEAEELFDLTAAYVRDGLAGDSKVMWLGDDGRGPAVAELALAEAVRLEGDLMVNMTALAFIDARCTLMIADAARAMAASRPVTLWCLPEIAAGFVLGRTGMPGIKLVSADGR
jgi:hypothetical protein